MPESRTVELIVGTIALIAWFVLDVVISMNLFKIFTDFILLFAILCLTNFTTRIMHVKIDIKEKSETDEPHN